MFFLAHLALSACLAVQETSTTLVTRELPDGFTAEFEVRIDGKGNEVPHGEFTLLDDAGRKRVEGFYENGERSKKWRFLDEDRQTFLKGSYREGQRSGSWTLKYPDGEVRAEGKYKDGQMTGVWHFYESSGERDELHWGRYAPYSDDFDDRRAGLDAGPLASGQRLEGLAHGVWTFYWPTGRPMLEAEFARGFPVGAWRFWHPDGSPDAWMFQGIRGESRWPRSLSEDPIPIGLEQAASGSGLDLDLAAYADLAEPSQLTDELLGLSEASLTTSGPVPAQLAELDFDALPPALDLLRACDYTSEDGQETARQALDYVTQVLRGHGLLPPEQARDPRALKLAAMRAHAVYHLWRNSESPWALELAFGSRPTLDSGDLKGGVLCQPPLKVVHEHAPAPVPLAYAARFSASEHFDRRQGKEVEQAVAEGLDWLATYQRQDGSWAAEDDLYDVGVTALALLSFLAEGNTLTKGNYVDTVELGVRWLLAQQDLESGRFQRWVLRTEPGTQKQTRLISFADLYNHAIATQAVCELAAVSPSPTLIERAKLATQLILWARSPYLAWRYEVPSDGDNDSSMTTWMTFALLAADRLGAPLDPSTGDGANRAGDWRHGALAWFNEVTDETGRCGYVDRGGFSNRYVGVNEAFDRFNTRAMTAAGMACRIALGGTVESDPMILRAAELLLDQLPVIDAGAGDPYYWHLGSTAMNAVGDEWSEKWFKSLHWAALGSQVTEGRNGGSWDPNGPWGMLGGRAYATAMTLLSLQAPYRYVFE
jgi:hypothetical protein